MIDKKLNESKYEALLYTELLLDKKEVSARKPTHT